MKEPTGVRRVVRLTIKPDSLDAFIRIFESSKDEISSQPGCLGVTLWQDTRWPNIVTTYSIWVHEDALNDYRNSVFFRETWAKTKPLFAAPPIAHSYDVIG